MNGRIVDGIRLMNGVIGQGKGWLGEWMGEWDKMVGWIDGWMARSDKT